MHIANLYKEQDILLFKKCWALEKVHGTSAHIRYHSGVSPALTFFSGGESHDRFVKLFDYDKLFQQFTALGHVEVTIFGEAYGGKQQGMRLAYGDELRFIAFDVQVGKHWLAVPDMVQVIDALGLECVPYEEIVTELVELDRARDQPSVVSVRRGMGEHMREGVVLRPPIEVIKNNGSRIIAKHKTEKFSERATPQKVIDPDKLVVLEQATAIAQEWVTSMRLQHVLGKLDPPHDMAATPRVIRAMVADVYREAVGEIVESKEARAAIGNRTVELYKAWIQAQVRALAT
jgi:hypothetical protein